jgi:hypothetical protein
MGHLTGLVLRILTGAMVWCIAAEAGAQDAPAARSVGGHIGLATPLFTATSDDNSNIGDQFTLVAPIGVTVKTGGPLAFDFEFQVANPIDPSGNTSLVIAPGLVYNLGPFAAGLRLASAIGPPANVGLIPLINRGVADLGNGVTWFVEAAFPMFVHAEPPDFSLDVVVHTGIGF